MNARIPLTLLEAFNKDFKANPYFNLIWGAVALESEFIYNLRFFGDYNFKFLEEKRNYKDDETMQDLFDIVKILFPSNGGLLSKTINASNKLCNELTCEDVMTILVAYFSDSSLKILNNESLNKISSKIKKAVKMILILF